LLSPLVDCSSIGTHHISRDDARRIVVIDKHVVKLSQMQYQLFVPLLQGTVVAEKDLLQVVYGGTTQAGDRENLAKLVRKVREQLLPNGVTIVCVAQRGYALLPVPE